MVNDPYRYEPSLQNPGAAQSSHGGQGQGFSIDPGDRPYLQAGGPIEPLETGRGGWFGRAFFYTLVAALCAGGIWYGAGRMRAQVPQGQVPLIHADASPVKVKPDNPSGVSTDESQPSYDRQASSKTSIEQLLPPPEAPMAKPQPTPGDAQPLPPSSSTRTETLVAPPPPPAREVAAVPVPKSVPMADTAPATRPLPSSMPASPTAAAPQKLGAPANLLKPAPHAQAAAAVPQFKASKGPVRVQIAATKTPADAQAEWRRLQHAHADLLGDLQPTYQKADLGARGVFYRIQAGPLADRGQGDKLCQALKQVSIGCIVIHP